MRISLILNNPTRSKFSGEVKRLKAPKIPFIGRLKGSVNCHIFGFFSCGLIINAPGSKAWQPMAS